MGINRSPRTSYYYSTAGSAVAGQRLGRRSRFDSLDKLDVSLRAPSECLPLARRRLGEDVSADSRIARKAGIGLVDRNLIINLNRRKRMSSGSEMARICACGAYAPDSLELHVPQLSRPVCRLWPPITRKTATVGPLFAGWAARKVLRELRAPAQLEEWW